MSSALRLLFEFTATLVIGSMFFGCGLFSGEGRRRGESGAQHDRLIEEGRAFARTGNFTEAVEAFEDATYAEPESAEAHFLHARALLEVGRSYPALDALRRAERLRPEHSQQRILLGRVYLRLNRLEEAERVITSAVATWPEEPRAHAALGRLHLQRGRLEASELSLTRAARNAPRLPGIQELLGRVLLRLGRVDQAIACFNRAVEQRECDDLAHGGLATAYFMSLDPGRAQSEFRAAIDCAEESHALPWQAGLALSLAAERRYADALLELERRGRIFPERATFVFRDRLEFAQQGWEAIGCTAHETICSRADLHLWSAALLLFVMGAPDAAENELQESLSEFDGDAATHWLMAEALAELDRTEDALLALDRAGAWQPSEAIQAAMQALRSEVVPPLE